MTHSHIHQSVYLVHVYLRFNIFLILGFLLTTMLFLPFGRGQLREAIGMQLFSFFCFFFMMGVFHYELFMRGTAECVCVYVCVCVCVCMRVCVYIMLFCHVVMSCNIIYFTNYYSCVTKF